MRILFSLFLLSSLILTAASPSVRIGGKASAPERFARDEALRLFAAAPEAPDLVIGTPETNPDIAAKRSELGLDLPEMRKRDSFVLKKIGNTVYAAANSSAGAAFAVWEFFERAGVRWFYPGPDGEYLPETWDFSLKDAVRSAPAFEERSFGAHYEKNKYIFLNHMKMHYAPDPKRLGSEGYFRVWGGHSFNWVFPRDCRNPAEYFAKHPEQFAWRSREKKRVEGQHCFSNPETLRTFVTWVRDFWDRNPGYDALKLVPKDTALYCQCERCAAADPSTVLHRFIASVIGEVEKTHPGKHYQTIAYSFYSDPPETGRLPENELLSFCMRRSCYYHEMDDPACEANPKHAADLRAWHEKVRDLGSYGYDFIAFGDSPVLTPFVPSLASHLKFYRGEGLLKVSTEYHAKFDPAAPYGEQNLFINRYPVYACAKLMWDPDLDSDALLSDFCRVSFGAAAPAMERYYKAMEDAWRKSRGALCGYNGNYRAHTDDFMSDELIRTCDAAFGEALAKASGERARRDIEADLKAWSRWKTAYLLKRDMAKIAESIDDRSDVLKNAVPGRILYRLDPALGNRKTKLHPHLEETCTVCFEDEQESSDGLPGLDADGEKGGPYIAAAKKRDAEYLFTNHPRIFTDSYDWYNYETSFELRFPPGAGKTPPLRLLLRVGGARFGADAVSKERKIWRVDILPQGFRVFQSSRPADEERRAAPLYKFPRPLGRDTWYRFSFRFADHTLCGFLDGKEIFSVKGFFGSGFANLSLDFYELRNFTVREIK